MKKLRDLFKKENTCVLLATVEGKHREKYSYFRTLLDNNHIGGRQRFLRKTPN